jgi:hypothetical protein
VARWLTLLLLVALAIACDDATPEPTFWAPDDLVSVLPRAVGDITLEIEGSGGREYAVEALGEAALDRLLVCKMPNARCLTDRLHFALASGSGSADGPRLVVFALRVEGVPAMDLVAESGSGPFVHVTPADAAEYAPIVRELVRPGEGWLNLYPLGEVLFGAVVTADGLGVSGDDFIAALPSCRRYGSQPCRGPS